MWQNENNVETAMSSKNVQSWDRPKEIIAKNRLKKELSAEKKRLNEVVWRQKIRGRKLYLLLIGYELDLQRAFLQISEWLRGFRLSRGLRFLSDFKKKPCLMG